MAGEDLSKLRIDRSGAGAATGAPKQRRKLKLWAVIAVLVALGLYYVFGYRAATPVEAMVVTTAYPSQAFTVLNATGYVVAQRKAAVASKATGRLEWLGVREGSQVKENEILARLENKDVTATMEQAAANIKLAQANLEQGQAELTDAMHALDRSRDLLAKNFVSQAAHDTVVARYEKAKAAISGYKAALAVAQAAHRATQVAVDQTLIRAPFDGVVLTKNANVGDVITPFSSATGSQAAVVTMADMSTLEVEADVSESSLAKVSVDQPCEIQLDALPDLRFRGVVHRLVPTVDRAKATVMVKIGFVDRDPRILPEMSAKVAFLSQEISAEQQQPLVAVSAEALAQRDGRTVIFVVRDDRAVAVPVTPGTKLGPLTAIAGDARSGDKAVLRPAPDLADGAPVKVAGK